MKRETVLRRLEIDDAALTRILRSSGKRGDEEEITPESVRYVRSYLDAQARRVVLEHGQSVTPSTAKPDALSSDYVAYLLGVSPATIGRWRKEGKGPKWFSIPGTGRGGMVIKYDRTEVDKYLKERGDGQDNRQRAFSKQPTKYPKL